MSLRFAFAALSDTGLRRRENQDRWLLREDLELAAIADGMGGLPHGAEAAQAAIDGLLARIERRFPSSDADWRGLLEHLNRDVHALGQRLGAKPGIGTTLTLLAAKGSRLTVAHVGDSAAFRLRDGRLEQLTKEHTVAAEIAELEQAGLKRPAPFGAEHMLSSCLGLPFLPQQDVHSTHLAAGDRLLICSDGLSKPVDLETITETLIHAPTPEAAARTLVDLANAAGGPDNITVIVGFCATASPATPCLLADAAPQLPP